MSVYTKETAVAVKVLRDVRPFDTSIYGFRQFHRDDVVDGPVGVWLADQCPADVMTLDQEPDDEPEPGRSDEPKVDDTGAVPAVETVPEPDRSEPVEAGPFDPAEHTGPEVIAYAKANPDQAEALFSAEKAGKARTTVLGALADLAG